MPLSITGSSASDTISKVEAQALVEKAYYFCRGARAYILKSNEIVDYSQRIIVNLDEYSLPQFKYHRVIEENLPGGSYEEMCEYAKTIYSEDIAPYAYKYSARYSFDYSGNDTNIQQQITLNNCSFETNGNHYPLFYINEGGELFSSVCDFQIPLSFALIDDNDNTKTYYLSTDGSRHASVKIISGDSHFATAQVEFIWKSIDNIPPFDIQTVECKFVKTNDGWRIDESEFSVLCATSDQNTLESYRAAVSPSTSDPSFDLVFILPTVSVAALASAFCLMRRRRNLI